MSYPRCFESQEQFDKWLAADRNAIPYNGAHEGRHTAICADCTPMFAARMREEGRCEHPEMLFYRAGKAFRGDLKVKVGVKPRIEMDVKWELCDVEEFTDAKIPGPDEGTRVPLRDNRAPPA